MNLPAKNRFNIGFNFNRSRFLGDLTVTYSGQRVLAGRARRPLSRHDRAYTLVNGGFGVKWANNR